MQERCAGMVASARLEKTWMSDQIRLKQTRSLLWERAQSTKFHNLEHVKALESRQRTVLIKISYKIGTKKKSISGIISPIKKSKCSQKVIKEKVKRENTTITIMLKAASESV